MTALTFSSGTAHAQLGNRALLFTGEGGGGSPAGYAGLTNQLINAGAAGVDTNSSTLSGANLANYRLVFLLVNTSMSAGSIATLQSFYANGGTIVGVADGRAYKDASGPLNTLTTNLGFGAMFTSSEFDALCTRISTASGINPLNANANNVRYAYGSDVNGGTLVYAGETMDLVRYNTRFIAIGDMNAISEDCQASPSGNLQFYANMWTYASSFITCGNGIVDPNEECDDANQVNTDNCTNFCKNAKCGDGYIRTGVETCDDGNTDNSDACTNACQTAACGDGYVRTGIEQCDDANQVNTDACLNTCVNATCGDGFIRDGVEQCDDQNQVNTDSCLNTCMNATCGDGFVRAGVEACDDGNQVNTDGCLSTCVVASCGDGFVQTGTEQCDDGNQVNTDACLSTCIMATCGDGFVQAGVEECDDTNLVNTDDCLANCTAAKCGDGVVHAGSEMCDDGNQIDADACKNNCSPPSCGDGVVSLGLEDCDTGGASATCNENCTTAKCGDGIVNTAAGEECDGSADCTAECLIPAPSDSGGCCDAGGTTPAQAAVWALLVIGLRRGRRSSAKRSGKRPNP